jgi:CRISPR-associated endonuclease Csn1
MLNEALLKLGMLPAFGSDEWREVMAKEPLALRTRGLSERLEPHDVGRALYHLAQRRHFKGRELDEGDSEAADEAAEKEAKSSRETTLQFLKRSGNTLGEFLSRKGPHDRKRGTHATRAVVLDEFDRFWAAQSEYHLALANPETRAWIEDTIFAQRPVFWRKNTLGTCPLMPQENLCPKGAWVSQQRRMLEKLNNLAIIGGNARSLDAEERAAILEKLQVQASMRWGSVRAALKPIFKAREEKDRLSSLRFNLEEGGDPALLGNAMEAKLAEIFGAAWSSHPHRQAIRDAVHGRLWSADYGEMGEQRVVIRPETERRELRAAAEHSFTRDFGATSGQAAALAALKLPSGWEPYSYAALERLLPRLEQGARFGALINGPEWAEWRDVTFPNRARPTGEVLDRLPSPADKAERERLAQVRNPTVVRAQNELRKVVNNLIGLYGKPDLIRIELAREVGKSKRERKEMQDGLRKQEARRKAAATDLRANGIEPSRDDIEKYMLWLECGKFDPYSGKAISFEALFGHAEFDVEHIWPRSRSFDNSYGNKTLCLKKLNVRKANRTPFEAFGTDPDWVDMKNRVWRLAEERKMPQGKAKRFCREEPLDDDFVSRQLNDTGFAARQAIAFLKRLWPDVGIEAPVAVQAVNGRVTAQLRKVWGLNNILSDDGEKTRADHRHHAVDALVVACAHAGLTQRLSSYWQVRDGSVAVARPEIAPPWPSIRADADIAVGQIVVSHRVRRKISGPLHKETFYGDTGCDAVSGKTIYRYFVVRKRVEALSKMEIEAIRDPAVKEIISKWVALHGGDLKKAFTTYPRLGSHGQEIRRVRLLVKQQEKLMAQISDTTYADLGANHHVAIYKLPSGRATFNVVSLLEASRRLARRESIVQYEHPEHAEFLMSLSAGDTIRFAREEREAPQLWRVQKIASKGQISLLHINDASPLEPSLFEPTVGGIIARNAVKLSIDPIGRVRPAHD